MGILYVFLVFQTAGLAEKIRRDTKPQLRGAALEGGIHDNCATDDVFLRLCHFSKVLFAQHTFGCIRYGEAYAADSKTQLLVLAVRTLAVQVKFGGTQESVIYVFLHGSDGGVGLFSSAQLRRRASVDLLAELCGVALKNDLKPKKTGHTRR